MAPPARPITLSQAKGRNSQQFSTHVTEKEPVAGSSAKKTSSPQSRKDKAEERKAQAQKTLSNYSFDYGAYVFFLILNIGDAILSTIGLLFALPTVTLSFDISVVVSIIVGLLNLLYQWGAQKDYSIWGVVLFVIGIVVPYANGARTIANFSKAANAATRAAKTAETTATEAARVGKATTLSYGAARASSTEQKIVNQEGKSTLLETGKRRKTGSELTQGRNNGGVQNSSSQSVSGDKELENPEEGLTPIEEAEQAYGTDYFRSQNYEEIRGSVTNTPEKGYQYQTSKPTIEKGISSETVQSPSIKKRSIPSGNITKPSEEYLPETEGFEYETLPETRGFAYPTEEGITTQKTTNQSIQGVGGISPKKSSSSVESKRFTPETTRSTENENTVIIYNKKTSPQTSSPVIGGVYPELSEEYIPDQSVLSTKKPHTSGVSPSTTPSFGPTPQSETTISISKNISVPESGDYQQLAETQFEYPTIESISASSKESLREPHVSVPEKTKERSIEKSKLPQESSDLYNDIIQESSLFSETSGLSEFIKSKKPAQFSDTEIQKISNLERIQNTLSQLSQRQKATRIQETDKEYLQTLEKTSSDFTPFIEAPSLKPLETIQEKINELQKQANVIITEFTNNKKEGMVAEILKARRENKEKQLRSSEKIQKEKDIASQYSSLISSAEKPDSSDYESLISSNQNFKENNNIVNLSDNSRNNRTNSPRAQQSAKKEPTITIPSYPEYENLLNDTSFSTIEKPTVSLKDENVIELKKTIPSQDKKPAVKNNYTPESTEFEDLMRITSYPKKNIPLSDSQVVNLSAKKPKENNTNNDSKAV